MSEGSKGVHECPEDSSGKMRTGELKRGLSKILNDEFCYFCYVHPKKIRAA